MRGWEEKNLTSALRHEPSGRLMLLALFLLLFFLQRTSRPLSPGNSSKPKPERSQISTNIYPSGLCSIYFFSVTNKTSPKKIENRRKKRNPPIHTKPHKTHQTRPPFFGRHLPKSPSPPVFLSLSRISSLTSRVHPPSLSIPSPVLRAGFYLLHTTLDLWYVCLSHYQFFCLLVVVAVVVVVVAVVAVVAV